jgi:hypothetical protein
MASSWTSLQIATLTVAALTPLTVAGLGVLVAWAAEAMDRIFGAGGAS